MEDSMITQNQIRENSEDHQSFLRDMDHWEKEMKQKEAERKLTKISDDQEFPPIRNTLSRSTKKRNRHKKNKDKSNSKTTKETSSESNVRISGYNYKAWDKFDVDSELKKVDDGKKESSVSESSDEEEEMTVQSKRQLAIIKKDNGNKFFKAGSYDSAINCYTIGMELDPDNALLPANRAMAFLKKDQFQAAENDCNLCLSIDPTYVKAYLRRGSARSALKKLFLAKSDFMKALEIEPDNKQAQLELEKVNKDINTESHSWELEDMEAAQESIFLTPKNSNVEIMEIQEEENTSLKQKDVVIGSCNGKVEEIETALNGISLNPSNSNAKLMAIHEVTNKKIESPLSKHAIKNDVPAKLTEDNLCDSIENVLRTIEPTLPPVPTASFQFLTHWKTISKYPELKYSYLKQISPKVIEDLFKHYIEPELFPEILHTLSTSFIENGEDVYPYMKSLATVGRFSTMLMFLSDSEKEDIKKLKSYLEMSGYDPSEVTAIMRLYGL